MNDDTIIILNYWNILVKRRKLIGLIIGGTFFVSTIISFLLPKIYVSTTSILPPQQESSMGIGMAAASQLAGSSLGGLAGGFLGLKSPADLWVGILKSETIQDEIISRFDLKTLYQKKTIEDTRAVLNKNFSIRKSKEDIISITVENDDPQRASEMANAFVEELDRMNKRIVMTSGGRMRSFVEKRLNEQKIEVEKIEEQVKDFQEKNGAVKLDDQSKAIFETIGKVKGQLMAKEIELQTLLSFATPSNPQAELLKSQVEEIRGGLRELEEGKKGAQFSSKSVFIPTMKIPDLALQYARLLRDAKVQETLYSFLTQQYEMARIQEAKDSPTVQVLDVAKIPEKKSKPKQSLIVILSTFMATFLAVFIAVFMEFSEKAKSETGGPRNGLGPPQWIREETREVEVAKVEM